MSENEKQPRRYVERGAGYEPNGGEWVGVRVVNRCMDPERLRGYAEHGARVLRQAVAANIYTPTETLDALAHDVDPLVREQAARNRSTPADTLRWLAEDGDIRVRRALNLNSAAPLEVLQAVKDATSADDLVRLAEAAELNLARGAADDPLDNPEALAAHWAKKRTGMGTSEDLPTQWAGQGGYRTAFVDRLVAISRNPQCPPALREHLAALIGGK